MVLKNAPTPQVNQPPEEVELTALDKALQYKVPILIGVVAVAVIAVVIVIMQRASESAETDAWASTAELRMRAAGTLRRNEPKDAADLAIELDSKLSELSGSSVAPVIQLYKGRLQALAGNYDEAIATLEKLKADHPGHAFASANGEKASMVDRDLESIQKQKAFYGKHGKPFANRPKPKAGLSVTLTFKDYGDIKLGFFPDIAPEHVANFIRLAREGEFDGTTIHRITDFCIQGGDPNSKNDDPKDDGLGGPGYSVEKEIFLNPLLHTRGTLSAAASRPNGPDSGSQWFICTKDEPNLDGGYTPYGEVLEGMDVVDKIFQEQTHGQNDGGIAPDHPVKKIVVEKATVEGDFKLDEKAMPGYLERKEKAEEEAKDKG